MTNHHRKGSRWRHDVEEWFAEAGFGTTVRGIGFAGDDILIQRPARALPSVPALRLSVEAKNCKAIELQKFVDQAIANANAESLPVVVAHRPRRTSVDDAYVVMPGWAFLELVTR